MSFNIKNQNHKKHYSNSYSDSNRHLSKNNERERSRDNHNKFHNNNISSIKILLDDVIFDLVYRTTKIRENSMEIQIE